MAGDAEIVSGGGAEGSFKGDDEEEGIGGRGESGRVRVFEGISETSCRMVSVILNDSFVDEPWDLGRSCVWIR